MIDAPAADVPALRLGSPGDPLSVARAAGVAARLGAELVSVGTGGALTAALRAGDVDAIVGAYGDLPVEPEPGIVVAAVPKRADARDAVVSADGVTLDALPAGARIGASTPLRRAQLLARRPDLEVIDGGDDVAALLGRVGADVAAVVVGAADLDALGRIDAAAEFLGIDGWPTAPAQGALAIQVRAGDEKRVARLDHRPSRLAAQAERGVLERLAVSGASALGAHALLDDGLLFLSARLVSLDGSTQRTSAHALYPEDAADPAAELAGRVAAELSAAGADDRPSGGGGR